MGRTCVHVMPGRPASGDGRWEVIRRGASRGSCALIAPSRAAHSTLQCLSIHPIGPIYPPRHPPIMLTTPCQRSDGSLADSVSPTADMFPRCPSPLSLTYSVLLSPLVLDSCTLRPALRSTTRLLRCGHFSMRTALSC